MQQNSPQRGSGPWPCFLPKAFNCPENGRDATVAIGIRNRNADHPEAAPSAAEGSPRGTPPQTLLRDFHARQNQCVGNPQTGKKGGRPGLPASPLFPFRGIPISLTEGG